MILKNILVAFALTIAYNLVFFKIGFGLGFGLFIAFINSAFYFFSDHDARNKPVGIAFSIISVGFGLLTVFRANEVIMVLNGMVAILFSLAGLYFYKDRGSFSFKIPDFIGVPVIAFFKGIDSIFKLFSADTFKDEKVDSGIFKSVAKGSLLAVPLLAVLVFLLTRADPVFSKYTSDVLSTSFERILFSAVIFIGTLCLSMITIYSQSEEKPDVIHSHKGYELSIVLGSVAVLFGLFITVQFQYLFSQSSERDLAVLGIKSLTYSEYVRKGFFELMIATVITSGILMYVLSNIRKLKSSQRMIVQIFSTVVVLETIMLIISAAQRVNLYQIEHGLTRARVFGFIFYVYLAVFLILIMVQILKRFGNRTFFTSHLVVGLATLLSVNVINIDSLIARDFKPTVNEETDYYYIASLSSDAYESWEEILTEGENLVSESEAKSGLTSDDLRKLTYISKSADFLEQHFNRMSSKRWQEFNITNNFAYTHALENELIKRTENIRNRIAGLQNQASESAKENIRLDRDTSPPLVR